MNLPSFLILLARCFLQVLRLSCKDVLMIEQAKDSAPNKLRLSSFVLGSHRIDVATPTRVSANTPILIMHDGGNLLVPREQAWNGQNWGITDSLEAGLVNVDLLPIVIGVYTGEGTSRYNELSPAPIAAAAPEAFETIPIEARPASHVSNSVEYHEFLAKEVLPKVAAEHGIDLHPSRTAIGGSSMGGLASIHGLAQHPDVYGTALAFSTHWPFGGSIAVELLIDALPAAGGGNRLWLDSGNKELDEAYPPFHYEAIDRLIEHGWRRDQDFEARIYAGTGHQEKYWAARWPDAVNWWLSASPR
jgi:predicted alpha/beta superfamily hydrolase